MFIKASSQYRRLDGRSSAFARQRGVMLILAVFAVVLLTVLVVGITAAVRVELFASRASVDRMQSLFAAEAGLNQARAILLYEDQTFDTLFDDWGPLAEVPLEIPQTIGDAYFSIRIHDACGRMNVNYAPLSALTRLIGDEEVASAITSWREVRTWGDEAERYREAGFIYEPRGDAFQTPGELLLVRGITPGIYFGSAANVGLADVISTVSESRNVDALGRPRIHLDELRNWSEPAFQEYMRERLGNAIDMYIPEAIFRGLVALTNAGQPGYTSLGQLYTVVGLDMLSISQIVDRFSADTDPFQQGKININTAPLAVLAALPGSSPGLAEAIAARREQEPFMSLGDFVRFVIEQPDSTNLFVQTIDQVTTKSSTFIIESTGWTESARTFRTIVALVRRTPERVDVLWQTERDWTLPSYEDYLDLYTVARR